MSIQEKNRVVMLWAGYGAGEIDVQFRKKAEECTRRGEPFGVYWHSYACTPDMAKKEAQYCAETIEEYKIFGPIVFIFSEDSSRYVQSRGIAVTEKLKKELVYAFCKAMKEYGYDAEGRADAN